MQTKPRTKLQRERERNNLSQEEVAAALNTTARTVSRWEQGESYPNPYFRSRLCQLFGKKADELDLELSGPQELEDALYDPRIPLQISLVDREHEIKHLKQRLLHGNVALYGLPGIGKSTLAIALTYDQDIRAHFSDGILWAGLGPAPNTREILLRWEKLLGRSHREEEEHPHYELAHILREHIAQSRYLLVLDDVWSVRDAAELYVGGPNCSHLVTTRFPAVALHTAPANAVLVQELAEEDGIELLTRLAPEVVEQEQERIAQLVQAVGGLPLALSLMGNYLRAQSYSGQRRRVRSALERLAQSEHRLHLEELQLPAEAHTSLPVETKRSLASIIAVSLAQLSETTRSALAALSLFSPKPHVFSEADALFVAQCTTDELDELSDAGMLLGENDGEYTLHPVVSDYAREFLHDAQAVVRFQQIIQQEGYRK